MEEFPVLNKFILSESIFMLNYIIHYYGLNALDSKSYVRE